LSCREQPWSGILDLEENEWPETFAYAEPRLIFKIISKASKICRLGNGWVESSVHSEENKSDVQQPKDYSEIAASLIHIVVKALLK
jgi:hypothetical protein